jgi:1-acyl-sn-glycerol-3-phosphate acyltransferase
MIAAALRRWLWRSVLGLTGGLTVSGPAPLGACVLVANHGSHADTPALLAALPARTRPVVAAAADYWFGGRARSWLCRLLVGGFPVRRSGGGSADLVAASRLLAAGRAVVVYPEGSRSRDGRLGRFRSGAGRLAAQAGVPLVPVAITGTRELLPVHGKLHRTRVAVRFCSPATNIDEARSTIAAIVEGVRDEVGTDTAGAVDGRPAVGGNPDRLPARVRQRHHARLRV